MTDSAGVSLTVAEVARRYLRTLPAGDPAHTDVLQFVHWLQPNKPLSSIRGHDVATWSESLSAASPDAERRADSIRGFLAFLKKQGLTGSNLGTHVRFRRLATRRRTTPRSAAGSNSSGRQELTSEAHQTLLAELEALKAERPRIAEELSRAMADKDFRENAPLDATRDKQAHLEARIRGIENALRVSDIVTGFNDDRLARLGATVVLVNLQSGARNTYTLVSPNEVSPSRGKISVASPIGKALLEHKPGDEVQVSAPSGVQRYRIESVES